MNFQREWLYNLCGGSSQRSCPGQLALMLPAPDSLGQTSELWDNLQLEKLKEFELECWEDLVLREEWHS